MEIIDIEKLMQQKYDECLMWLNGKDEAHQRLEMALIEYETAKKEFDAYSDVEYVEKLIAYKDYLKSKLGIVDDGNEQVEEEQKVEEATASEEVVCDTIAQPLI